jgi:hypothetical protein
METGENVPPPSPQERIRKAAVGHLLDAEAGLWERVKLNRTVTFTLEANDPHEEDALSIVHVISKDNLFVAVTHFSEDLAATEPMDIYQVRGFTVIGFPDTLSSEITVGHELPQAELDRTAAVLENESLEELNRDTLLEGRGLEKAIALSEAGLTSFHLWTDWIVDKYRTDAYSANAAHSSKSKGVASKLRRILNF